MSKPGRFHGAFTGGFSAGYFNTVGSEEGFKPKSFVSTRQNRAERKFVSAKDFMDQDDGLLGGQLVSKKEFDTFDEHSSKVINEATQNIGKDTIIPGPIPSELVARPTNSVGKQILKLMGWKDGHGIGAHKTISVTVPSNISHSNLPFAGEQFLNVPTRDELTVVRPPVKTDVYGIGFNPEEANPEMFKLQNKHIESRHGRKTLKDILQQGRQTIPVHAHQTNNKYDDDDYDEDDYDSSSNRNMTERSSRRFVDTDLSDDSSNEDGKLLHTIQSSVDSWLKSGDAETSMVTQLYPSDGKPILAGFTLSTKSAQYIDSDKYPLIVVPPDFDPYDNLVTRSLRTKSSNVDRLNTRMERKSLFNSSEFGVANLSDNTINDLRNKARSNMYVESKKLGTEPPKSVFEFLSESSRLKLKSALDSQSNKTSYTDLPISTQIHQNTVTVADDPFDNKIKSSRNDATADIDLPTITRERPYLAPEHILKTTYAGVTTSFRNRFVSSSHPSANNPLEIAKAKLVGLTTLEEHEQARAIVHSSAATDIHATGNIENSTTRPSTKIRAKRQTSMWFPTPLLCKRFNVPVPDPTLSIKEINTIQSPMESNRSLDAMMAGISTSSNTTQLELKQDHPTNFTTNPKLTNVISVASDVSRIKSTESTQYTIEPSTTLIAPPENNSLVMDEYLSSKPKPSISLFKSIFEDDSSDEDEEQDEESEKFLVPDGNTEHRDNESLSETVSEVIQSSKDFTGSKEPTASELLPQRENTTGNTTIEIPKILYKKPNSIESSLFRKSTSKHFRKPKTINLPSNVLIGIDNDSDGDDLDMHALLQQEEIQSLHGNTSKKQYATVVEATGSASVKGSNNRENNQKPLLSFDDYTNFPVPAITKKPRVEAASVVKNTNSPNSSLNMAINPPAFKPTVTIISSNMEDRKEPQVKAPIDSEDDPTVHQSNRFSQGLYRDESFSKTLALLESSIIDEEIKKRKKKGKKDSHSKKSRKHDKDKKKKSDKHTG